MPLLFGKVVTEEKSNILSMPVESEGHKAFDVIFTLKVFSIEFIVVYFSWMLIAWLFFIVFSFVVRRVSNQTMSSNVVYFKPLWDIIQAFCEQDNFPIVKYYCIRAIGLVIVVGIFFVNQYYYGYFHTDLTIAPKAKLIETFEDLKATNRTPVMFLGDFGSLVDLEVSSDPLKRNLQPRKLYPDIPSTMSLVDSIRQRKAVFYGLTNFQQTLLAIYCRNHVLTLAEHESPKYFHVGKRVYLKSVRAMIMKKNISSELRRRVNWGFGAILESGAYHKGTVQDLAEKLIAYVGTPYTFDMQNCVAMKSCGFCEILLCCFTAMTESRRVGLTRDTMRRETVNLPRNHILFKRVLVNS